MTVSRLWTIGPGNLGSPLKTVERILWSNRNQAALIGSSGSSMLFIISATASNGQIYDRVPLTSNVTAAAWSSQGDILAFAQEKSSIVTLWNSDDKLIVSIETNMKLVMGTSKGNVIIYSRLDQKKIPILGKHGKAVTDVSWFRDQLFALASEDRCISFNSVAGNGDTLAMVNLGGKVGLGKIKFMGREANLGCITDAHSFALVSSASGAEQKTHPQISVPKGGASCILDFAYSPSEENVILVTDQGTLIIANVLQMGGGGGGGSSSSTISLALVKEIGLWANIKGRASFACMGKDVILLASERSTKVFAYDGRAIDNEDFVLGSSASEHQQQQQQGETTSDLVEELGVLMRDDRMGLEFVSASDWSPDYGSLLVGDKDGSIQAFTLSASICFSNCSSAVAHVSLDKKRVHCKSFNPLISLADLEPAADSGLIQNVLLHTLNSQNVYRLLIQTTSNHLTQYIVKQQGSATVKWTRQINDLGPSHAYDQASETLVYISRSSCNVVVLVRPGSPTELRVASNLVATGVFLDAGNLLLSGPDSLRYHSIREDGSIGPEHSKILLKTEVSPKLPFTVSKSLGRVLWIDRDGALWISRTLSKDGPKPLLPGQHHHKTKRIVFASTMNMRNCNPNLILIVSESEATLYLLVEWTVLGGETAELVKVAAWKIPRNCQIVRFYIEDFDRISLECLTPSNSFVLAGPAESSSSVLDTCKLLYFLGAKRELYKAIRSLSDPKSVQDLGLTMLNLMDIEAAFKFCKSIIR